MSWHRVIVEADSERLAEPGQVFASLGTFEGLIEGLRNDQIETIITFLNRASAGAQEAITFLRQQEAAKAEKSNEATTA